jgi:dihydropteroate synthase
MLRQPKTGRVTQPIRLHEPQRPPWMIMGILNLTPDSFYKSSRVSHLDDLCRRAEAMLDAGAHYLDLGAESTRPGAQAVSADQELERLLPAIEMLKQKVTAALSIDTYKTEVMRHCLPLGITMINDINALQDEGALDLVAQHDVDVCLMHKQGLPNTMQTKPQYEDVVAEVYAFLQARLNACLDAGIAKHRVCLDPGFGFGKTLAHNVALLKNIKRFAALKVPVLVGLSRKSMFDQLFQLAVEDRLVPSVVAALLAVQQGATIVRTHDVAATRQALQLAEMIAAT